MISNQDKVVLQSANKDLLIDFYSLNFFVQTVLPDKKNLKKIQEVELLFKNILGGFNPIQHEKTASFFSLKK